MKYQSSLENIDESMLKGFFVGWPNPPSEATFHRMLDQSQHIWLAVEGNKVVGFVNAISDGVLSAYIPLLEVLPEYQGQGIGSTLMRKMLETCEKLYMIDLACDPDKAGYYEQLGFGQGVCMVKRNYERQSGV